MTTKIICLETKQVFESIKDASKQMNINDTSIGKVCRGKRNTAGGYTFKYFDVYEAETNTKPKTTTIIEPKAVQCIETGQVFNSIAEAGRTLQIDASSIGKVCRGKLAKVKGLTFKYYNKETHIEEIKQENPIKEIPVEEELTVTELLNQITQPVEEVKENPVFEENNIKRVLCIETGKIFNTLGEAAKTMNISKSSIGKVCRGVNKSAGGYTFKYITEKTNEEWFGEYLKDSKYKDYDDWYNAIKNLWKEIQCCKLY